MSHPICVTPGVWLVGSGALGWMMTSRWDCNVYLLRTAAGWLLIDAGCGLASEQIATHVREVTSANLSGVLLTHAHADHAAGARSLSQLLECPVYALPETAAIMQQGDEGSAGLCAAREAGVYPPDVALRPTEVRPLSSGPDLGVTVLETPGHAAGHAVAVAKLGEEAVAFTGDLVFARSRLAVLDTSDTDRDLLAASLSRLRRTGPTLLLPGHCEPVLSEVDSCLDQAHADLARGLERALT